jgi:hypothetical protein
LPAGGTTVIDHCGHVQIGQVHLVCLPDYTIGIVSLDESGYTAIRQDGIRIDF